MKSFFLILALFVASAIADNRYWSGTLNTDWGNTANWGTTSGGTLASVPTEVDSVIFDNNSALNCSLSVADTVYKITSTTGWAKGFHQKSFALTTIGAISWDGTTGSFLTLNGVVTIMGNGDFHVGTGVATISFALADLYLKGSQNFDIDKVSGQFRNLYISYSGKTTTVTGSALANQEGGFNNSLTLNGGTLTLSQSILYTGNSNANPIVFASPTTINGTQGLKFYQSGAISSYTMNLPKLKMGGTTFFQVQRNATSRIIINQTDSVSVPSILLVAGNATDTAIFYNTNNYPLTASTDLSIGPLVASTKTVFNAGSSVITCGTWGAITDNTGTSVDWNLGTSTWYIFGNATIRSIAKVFAGTSLVVFKKTASFTSNGQSFYDVRMDSAGQTLTLASNLTANSLNINTGGFSQSTFSVKTTGDQTYNGAGNYTLAADTIAGNGNYTIGSSVGTVTLTNNRVRLMGTGNLSINKAGLSFPKMTVAQTGKVTTNTSTVKFNVSDSFMIGAGTLTNNGDTIGLMPASITTPLTIAGGATINGSGMLSINDTANTTIVLPAIAMTGTGTLALRNNGAKAATFTMGGAISAPNVVLSKESTGKLTINTGNYALSSTAGAIMRGNSNATDTLHINYGSSAVTCKGFGLISGTGITKNDFGSSVWSVGGNLVMPTANSIMGTSAWTMTSKATVSTNGNSFNKFIINSKPDTVSFSGNLTTDTFRVEPGSVVKYKADSTYTIATFTAGDWDGGAGADSVRFISSVLGTQYNFIVPTGISVNYVIPTDNAADDTIDATAATNRDGGNNTNWLFTSPDTTRPTVAITSTNTHNGISAFNARVTFSETVTGFTIDSMTATNATLSNFTGSGTIYNVLVTPTDTAEITLSIAENKAYDEYGNGNVAAPDKDVTYVAPVPSTGGTGAKRSFKNYDRHYKAAFKNY